MFKGRQLVRSEAETGARNSMLPKPLALSRSGADLKDQERRLRQAHVRAVVVWNLVGRV